MNIERLQAVRDAILADPKHYNQQLLFEYITNADKLSDLCETAACIAGRACLMFSTEGTRLQEEYLKGTNRTIIGNYFESWTIAEELLELTNEESDRLFSSIDDDNYPDDNLTEDGLSLVWPENFALDYIDATTGEERAKVAADRIDFFIKTNGTDRE